MLEVHPTFDTALDKILNAISDTCDRACHKVLFYVANKILLFGFSQSLCTRYHDIWKDRCEVIKNKQDIFL